MEIELACPSAGPFDQELSPPVKRCRRSQYTVRSRQALASRRALGTRIAPIQPHGALPTSRRRRVKPQFGPDKFTKTCLRARRRLSHTGTVSATLRVGRNCGLRSRAAYKDRCGVEADAAGRRRGHHSLRNTRAAGTGRRSNDVRPNRLFAATLTIALELGGGAAWAGLGQPSDWQLGLQEAGSPVMEDIAWFHDYLLLGDHHRDCSILCCCC